MHRGSFDICHPVERAGKRKLARGQTRAGTYTMKCFSGASETGQMTEIIQPPGEQTWALQRKPGRKVQTRWRGWEEAKLEDVFFYLKGHEGTERRHNRQGKKLARERTLAILETKDIGL